MCLMDLVPSLVLARDACFVMLLLLAIVGANQQHHEAGSTTYTAQCVHSHLCIHYPVLSATSQLQLRSALILILILILPCSSVQHVQTFYSLQIMVHNIYNTTHHNTLLLFVHSYQLLSSPLLCVSVSDGNHFFCRSCPYIHVIKKPISQRTYCKRKEVDDGLGGADAWKNVDQTEGHNQIATAQSEQQQRVVHHNHTHMNECSLMLLLSVCCSSMSQV